MRFLADAGIIVPDEIPSDEDAVPLDFTRLNSKPLGGLHSRYAVRHSHALFNMAIVASDLVRAKRDVRIAEAKFRIRHKSEKRKNVVDAMMEDDDEIIAYRDKITDLEAMKEIMEAVVHGYEALRNAASREMSRRIGERAATD